MAQVHVEQLKKGVVLSANVQSQLGGLLFEKGTKILDREYEILLAFKVDKVDKVDKEPAVRSEGALLPTIFSEPSYSPHSLPKVSAIEQEQNWWRSIIT